MFTKMAGWRTDTAFSNEVTCLQNIRADVKMQFRPAIRNLKTGGFLGMDVPIPQQDTIPSLYFPENLRAPLLGSCCGGARPLQGTA